MGFHNFREFYHILHASLNCQIVLGLTEINQLIIDIRHCMLRLFQNGDMFENLFEVAFKRILMVRLEMIWTAKQANIYFIDMKKVNPDLFVIEIKERFLNVYTTY